MRKPVVLTIALALSLIVLMWGYEAVVMYYSPAAPWGMMGPAMMGSRGGPWSECGPGVMMRGYGPNWGRDLNLSADTVKSELERWVTWQGNSRLKVGDVKEKDADTIVAEIVTKDSSLVQRFAVNRHTGFFQNSEN